MKSEKRLIDANALLEKLSRMIDYCENDNKVNGLTALFQVGDAVMDLPTIDAVEVVHGRWITHNKGQNNWCECSECNTVGSPFWKRCPMCEAKMDGDENA